MQDICGLIRVLNSLLHCLDRVTLSPLRTGWSLRLSANFPYMAYFTTVVTSGGPEWALSGLVVLLSTSVTITVQDCSGLALSIRGNLANVPRVWHQFSCMTRALQFACILGSRLHRICNLHGSLKCQIRLCQQLFLNCFAL